MILQKESRLEGKKEKRVVLQQMLSHKLYPEMPMTLPLAWFPTQYPLEALTTTIAHSHHLTESRGPYFLHTEGETHQDVHTDSAGHAYNIVISHTFR